MWYHHKKTKELLLNNQNYHLGKQFLGNAYLPARYQQIIRKEIIRYPFFQAIKRKFIKFYRNII